MNNILKHINNVPKMAVETPDTSVTYHVAAHLLPAPAAVELKLHLGHRGSQIRVHAVTVVTRVRVRNIIGKYRRLFRKWWAFLRFSLRIDVPLFLSEFN